MTAAAEPELVDEYGTGDTRTAVLRLPDGSGHRWIRSAGPERAKPLRAPSPATAHALRNISDPPLYLALPELRKNQLVYSVDGRESLADILMSQDRDIAYPRAAQLLERLGLTLRSLHTIPGTAAPEGKHPGILRLAAWLTAGTDGRKDSARLFSKARNHLGTQRWDRLVEWCEMFVAPGAAPSVLLHGRPGTGVVVPDREGASGALLTGEDMATGPPVLDTGWVLGELAEVHGVVRAAAGSAEADRWSPLARSFTRGYGRALPAGAGAVATLFMLTHLRDFCEFLGEWDEWRVTVALDLIAEGCETDGAGTLAWAADP